MNTYFGSYKICYQFMNALKQTRKASRNAIQEERSEQEIRITRHEKLIQMIRVYKRTPEEQERLIRIRNNTILQIDLRYRKSQISENYVFPLKMVQDLRNDDDQLNESIDGPTFYNLYSQNQIIIKHEKKHFENSPGRRIKSLDGRDSSSPNKVQELTSRKIRNHRQIQPITESPKKIQRSITQAKSIKLSPLIFPEIKKKEKLKTELHSQKDTISNIFSQKLLTQQSRSSKKKIPLLHKRF